MASIGTGTLDLNGNVQLVSTLNSTAAATGAGIGGGIITANNGGASGTFVTTGGGTFAGSINGANVNLLRSGSAALTLLGANNYGGATVLNGSGTTTLTDLGTLASTSSIAINYGTLALTNNTGLTDISARVNPSAPVSLSGGTITYTGRQQTASAETLGAVTLTQGLSTITVTAGGTGVNSADLTLTSLNRSVGGGTVNFTSASTLGTIGSQTRINVAGATTANVISGGLVNNIIPWATVNGTEFASYIPYTTNGVSVGGISALNTAGYAGYNGTTLPGASQTAQNIRITAAGAVPSIGTAGGYMLNSLNLNN